MDARRGARSCALLVALLVALARADEDALVAEARSSCRAHDDAYSCGKYRALAYLAESGATAPAPVYFGASRLLGLVRLDDDEEAGGEGYFGEEARQLADDSELVKLFKFAKRQAERLLARNALTVRLPEGARAVEVDEEGEMDNSVSDEGRARGDRLDREARGKKKKLQVMVPLLTLLSLFKMKLLLVPILLSVLFIKKILILATLFLPSILSTLKACKMPHGPSHGHGQWGSSDSVDYSSVGYGGGGGGYHASASGAGGYSKEWAASRAYNGYKQQQQQTAAQYRTLGDTAYSSNNLYAASAAATL